MSAHEDESTAQDAGRADDGAVSTDKPEPDDEDKEKAKEMMTAYEDRPTLVLPGSGKTITGTAVNDWLDDDGNPKYADDDDSPAAKAKAKAKSEDTPTIHDTDESPAENHAGSGEDAEGEGAPRKNTGESERAVTADETADDRGKSVDQLNKEAEERVNENLEKDKHFNREILEVTKKDREDRERAGT